jgi:hypothetical protein
MKVEGERDDAETNATQLENSRTNYAKDYSTVVRLGKAIPSTLDMPSLLVQLETASKGAKIDFDSITVGDRTTAAAPGAAATDTTTSQPASAAGGEQAQTGAGKAAENANEASNTSDTANQKAGADAGTTGTGAGTAAAGTSGVAGLDTVPLNFTFTGSYFDLADFFHRVKRFVRVANDDIRVKGRLMTIDTMTFSSDKPPTVTAKVTASVYLAPKSEGATGGATSQGPSTATPAAATPAPSTAAPASSTSSEGAQ